MLRKTLYLLIGLVWLTPAAPALAQGVPNEVHVKLSLKDNQTVFRSGEPIKLVMEFTAEHEGYDLDRIPDKHSSLSDQISIAPDTGIFHWAEEYLRGSPYERDQFSVEKLSATPLRLELLVNDVVRFDRAGRYSVRVATRRVSQRKDMRDQGRPIPLTTNEVSFDIQSMSNADEEKEVQRLSAALDAARDWRAEESLTQELSYLAGDVSSREKVRRFLNSPGRSGNYSQNVHLGLFIARNRALVFQLLEDAMRDPSVPVTSSLLYTLAKIRLFRESSGLPEKPLPSTSTLSAYGDPKLNAIQDAYVGELAASLGKRSGKSQTTTALTILTRLPKNSDAAAPVLQEVRRILLDQFDNLHPYDQEYLLRQSWDQMRDPGLTPAIKKILKSSEVASKGIHNTALLRLIEIAPAEARPFVIAEILDPASLVDLDTLKRLSDSTLPEIDAPLLDQIRRLSSSKRNYDVTYLRHKTALAARYASVSIYPDLMELYQRSGAALPLEAKAGLFAYFARYNEQEALPLIEQALSEVEPGQDFNLLPDLARLYYSEGIDDLLRKRLEGDEPRAVSTAAWLMSKYGPPSDEKIIEARLNRWRKEWSNRAAEAQTNLQGTAERELVLALIHATSWKATPERAKELGQSCVTDHCRQSVRSQ